MLSPVYTVLISILLCLYLIIILLYRLYFHPLARFPGPKLAAVTKWYEAYFDLLKRPGGMFMYEIDRMHDVYGPIVRINPDELHIKDSAWAEVLYVGAASGVRDKYPPAAHMTGTPQGIFGTVSHEIHRKRRAAISSFFSKAAINAREPMIHDKAELLCRGIRSQLLETGVAEMRVHYLAMTTDTLCSHAFEKPLNLLENERQAMEWQRTIKAIALLTPLVKQFTWIIPAALKLPLLPLQLVVPDLARIVVLHRDMHKQAETAISNHSSRTLDGLQNQKPGFKPSSAQSSNIFQNILSSDSLSIEEKRRNRIAQDGFVVLAAGGETTGRVLTNATYHLLANKETALQRLKGELASVMPDPNMRADIKTLERLPWLTAIIKESLRITALITSRLPLVSPNEPLQYQQWTIPAGVPVGMTLRNILLDPNFFSKPLEFHPERWLSSNPELDYISRAYLPFGRGSRMCIGINLALAELYITLAYVFRRFDLELYDTIRERDIDSVRDCFIGESAPDSRGVRVAFAIDRSKT